MMTTIEDSKDQIEAMLRQENKFYQCADYLDVEEPEPEFNPLHIVAECALLVTDLNIIEDADAVLNDELSILRSPNRVSKFSSPTSSTTDLTKSSLSASATKSSPSSANRCRLPVEIECLNTWRHAMLEWSYTVTDTFDIDRDVVAVSFSILDRYLAVELLECDDESEQPISREEFQLFSMVSMYIAIKVVVPFRKLTVDSLIDMSRGFYSEQDIVQKEQDILKKIQWHVHPPTVIDFCRLYMTQFPRRLPHEVALICQDISEMALDDAFFISKPSSSIALATILLATQQVRVADAKDTHGFLGNLRGLVNVSGHEFDGILRRLECLC